MKSSSHGLTLEILEDRMLLATCHVGRLGDFGAGNDPGGEHSRGDLRYCMNQVFDKPGPDVIDISVTGTINLTGPLPDLASDVEIRGPGAGLLTVRRDTGGDYRIFTVAGDSATISGLTISNGLADIGGGIYNQGTVTLDDVVIASNTSTSGQGGGIYNSGILELGANSIIRDNVALAPSGSDSGGYGGGLYNTAFGVAIIDSSTVADNKATGTSDWDGFGGGIFNAGSLTISFSTISGNMADAGLDSCLATTAVANGGGIRSEGALTIANSAILGNTAHAEAPPLCTDGFVVAVGGGMYDDRGTTTIDNSTIAGNLASAEGGVFEIAIGGGVYGSDGPDGTHGILTITHSTIADNSASAPAGFEFGGGLSGGLSDNVLHVQNSIIADNLANEAADLDGFLDSSGFNLIGNSSGGSGFAPTDILDVDPLLGPLQDNGGPTRTMALRLGSPAVDAGDNTNAPQWDQRGPGHPRIVNGTIDIGAFEVQAAALPIPNLDLAVLITVQVHSAGSKRIHGLRLVQRG